MNKIDEDIHTDTYTKNDKLIIYIEPISLIRVSSIEDINGHCVVGQNKVHAQSNIGQFICITDIL